MTLPKIMLAVAVGVMCGCSTTKEAAVPKEQAKELRTLLVSMICECGGEMKPTGQCLTSYPPQYPHVCDKCGKKETYHKSYPTLRYEDK